MTLLKVSHTSRSSARACGRSLLYQQGLKVSTASLPSVVFPFNEVYIKSVCQPRESLVDIFQQYPEDTEHTYVPSCVVLKRCGGCCNDEALECVATKSRNVTLQVRLTNVLLE